MIIFFLMFIYWVISYIHSYKTINGSKNLLNYLQDRLYLKLANTVFTIIFSYVPIIYIWLYSRSENFALYEVFDIESILILFSVEKLFALMIIFAYIILPFAGNFLAKEKWKKVILVLLLSILPILILVALTLKFIEIGNYELLISLFLTWVSFSLIGLSNFVYSDKKWVSLSLIFISLFIIIFNPMLTNHSLTRNTLATSNLGWFKVDLKNINSNKEINDICLLLRTKESLYIKNINGYIVYPTQNYAIKYNIPKKSCE